MHDALVTTASNAEKSSQYQQTLERIEALIAQESDWISAMATVVCELHHSFESFNWTGFYRAVEENTLKIGPYQGSHGCLMIPFSKGVCGKAATTKKTQLVQDVDQFPGHIACSTSTISEIVVPVISSTGEVIAVLDVDSNHANVFNEIDKKWLEQLCGLLGKKFC